MNSNSTICFLQGTGMVRYYLNDGGVYKHVPSSEKTIQEEYGSSVAPDIDAADMGRGTPSIVYLISGKYIFLAQFLCVNVI